MVWLPWLFALTLFTSAALLFVVQPMIGKMMLPSVGGVPAVWNTCMVFFQAVLLAGYAYAHASVSWLGARRQAVLHVVVLLLPFLVLPIVLPSEWVAPRESNPIGPLVYLLLALAGLPFFAVATSAPLLQHWFAESTLGSSRDPYVLYAASNAGSMLALLAYPFLVEPFLPLPAQSWLWAVGYGLLVVATISCALMLWRSPVQPASDHSIDTLKKADDATSAPDQSPPGPWTRCRWVFFSFVPSSLLLGVTTYLSTEVAPVPLLWILPLALYLLTFILVFGRSSPRLHRCMILALPVVLVAQAVLMVSNAIEMVVILPMHLLAFFVASMVCHGELRCARPPVRFLTEFYLWISVGGVLGGVFNALVAPFLFSSVVEYPLMLVVAALLMPAVVPNPSMRWLGWLNRVVPAVLAAAVGVLLIGYAYAADREGKVLLRERSFFGVSTVLRDSRGVTHTLLHGNVRHGAQIRSQDPRQRRLPMLYYFPTGPMGQVFQAYRGPIAKHTVAVIGLGIGSLASYGESGQEWTFFEIDPTVARIARTPQYFTHLTDAEVRGVKLRIEIGDARTSLRGEPDDYFDLLVLDAFSGDLVPTHLLTREAIGLYLRKLTRNGLLAFHITNTYLDFRMVLADQARTAELVALVQVDDRLSTEETRRGKTPSTWVVMARDEKDLDKLAGDRRWKRLENKRGTSVWTDDYSNIFQVFTWW
jgi:spermidine synthase